MSLFGQVSLQGYRLVIIEHTDCLSRVLSSYSGVCGKYLITTYCDSFPPSVPDGTEYLTLDFSKILIESGVSSDPVIKLVPR